MKKDFCKKPKNFIEKVGKSGTVDIKRPPLHFCYECNGGLYCLRVLLVTGRLKKYTTVFDYLYCIDFLIIRT